MSKQTLNPVYHFRKEGKKRKMRISLENKMVLRES